MPGKSQEELAEYRTMLAKQRTFSAWVRTGLAILAVGFGVAELLGDVEPQWLVTSIGAALVVAAAVVFVVAFWSYRHTLVGLEEEREHGMPVLLIALVTTVLVLCSLAGLVLVFN